jgi:hypothetical protein
VVTREPSVGGDNLNSDLVVKNQKGLFVASVTVRQEDGDYLARERLSKIEKYPPLLPEHQ